MCPHDGRARAGDARTVALNPATAVVAGDGCCAYPQRLSARPGCVRLAYRTLHACTVSGCASRDGPLEPQQRGGTDLVARRQRDAAQCVHNLYRPSHPRTVQWVSRRPPQPPDRLYPAACKDEHMDTTRRSCGCRATVSVRMRVAHAINRSCNPRPICYATRRVDIRMSGLTSHLLDASQRALEGLAATPELRHLCRHLCRQRWSLEGLHTPISSLCSRRRQSLVAGRLPLLSDQECTSPAAHSHRTGPRV